MAPNEKKPPQSPPVVRLAFRAGDLIVKQGDYGISIYRVVEGQVAVLDESGSGEVTIANLGPGEIIGEMIFLTGNRTRRTASVRAVEGCVLEAWHPARIQYEYGQMPSVMRYLANKVVEQLARYNRMITELTEIRRRKERPAAKPVNKKYRPRNFRKDVEIDCMYRPVESDESTHLWGKIRNLSKGGLRMDVRRVNALGRPHEVGSEFVGSTFLPTGKRLEFVASVAHVQPQNDSKTLLMGMRFVELPGNAESVLGFFLMG